MNKGKFIFNMILGLVVLIAGNMAFIETENLNILEIILFNIVFIIFLIIYSFLHSDEEEKNIRKKEHKVTKTVINYFSIKGLIDIFKTKK